MSRDHEYRSLRARIQALLDRDAPKDVVLIEVDWLKDPEVHDRPARLACIARNDIDGRYCVWTVGFIGNEPSSLNHGRYDVALATAVAEFDKRLWR